MSLQENIEKNHCPPLNHSGGGHFFCPPPEIAQAGDNPQGGDSPPPLKLLRGGTVPYSPPLYPLLCIVHITYMYVYYSV